MDTIADVVIVDARKDGGRTLLPARSANRELFHSRPVNNGYVLVVDTKEGPRNVVADDGTGRALRVVRYAPEYWRIVR